MRRIRNRSNGRFIITRGFSMPSAGMMPMERGRPWKNISNTRSKGCGWSLSSSGKLLRRRHENVLRKDYRMQIAVIGAGNMGSLYGANLARAGQSVALVDVWQEHVNQVQQDGLRMDGLRGSFVAQVSATTEPARAPKADIALVCVNAYSTREAANSAKVLLKDSGFALTLQNGLGNVEVLTEVLGQNRVMAGLSFHSAELRSPGYVTHTNDGPTYLGELDRSQSERLSTICDLLDRAGMNPTPVPDIWSYIWGKFIYNCAINAVCGITG